MRGVRPKEIMSLDAATITVITLTYKNFDGLKETIDSVLHRITAILSTLFLMMVQAPFLSRR